MNFLLNIYEVEEGEALASLPAKQISKFVGCGCVLHIFRKLLGLQLLDALIYLWGTGLLYVY